MGSAPLMHSALSMQPSGPGCHAGPLGYSPSVPQVGTSMLSPAGSAGFGSYPGGTLQRPQLSQAGSLGPTGEFGFAGAGFSATGDPQQQPQQQQAAGGAAQPQVKVKLKVQVQPVKRGRGRPPSRARLAAREVELVPIEVPVVEEPQPTHVLPVPEPTWHERQEMQRLAQMQQQQQQQRHSMHMQQQGSMQLQHSMLGTLDHTCRSSGMYSAAPAQAATGSGSAGAGMGMSSGMMMACSMSGIASGSGSGSLGGGAGAGASSSSQQQPPLQRKRSGIASGLDVLKPGKSMKVGADFVDMRVNPNSQHVPDAAHAQPRKQGLQAAVCGNQHHAHDDSNQILSCTCSLAFVFAVPWCTLLTSICSSCYCCLS